MDPFLLKQILMLSASCLHSFNGGIIHAFPSLLNSSLLSSNTTDFSVSPNELSWISASFGLSGIIGFIILSPIFQIFGRKPANLILNSFVLIGWIILYFANNVTLLVIGRLVQGLSLGGIYIIAITLGEYSHKKRRGYFIVLKKVSLAFGSLVCHSIGLIISWQKMIIIGVAAIILSMILILQCPESPAFLAMRGRFDESKKSFYWLFGQSAESKKELDEIIFAQTKSKLEKKILNESIVNQTCKLLLCKDFLRPFFIVVVATLALDATGRYFLLAYITQIMVEITGNTFVSKYCSSVADILIIIALCISCVIVKSCNRRKILFGPGSMSATLLLLVSLSTFLESKLNMSEMKLVAVISILLNSFISHIGLIPVIFTLTAEIFPLEFKGLGSLASGIIFSAFYFSTLKFTPVMLDKTGIQGTFAIYGLCVLFCLFILYFILPETKDKTLQEIENEIRRNKSVGFDNTNVELNLLCKKISDK